MRNLNLNLLVGLLALAIPEWPKRLEQAAPFGLSSTLRVPPCLSHIPTCAAPALNHPAMRADEMADSTGSSRKA